QRDVQRRGPAVHRDGVRHSDRDRELRLEPPDERADVRDPVRVDALLEVRGLVAAHDRDAQRNAAHRREYGGHRSSRRRDVPRYETKKAAATPAIDPAPAIVTARSGGDATRAATANGTATPQPTAAAMPSPRNTARGITMPRARVR